MKKVTSTFITLLLCLYVTAQVGGALDGGFNSTAGYLINPLHATDDYGQAVGTHSDGRVVVAAYNTDQYFTLLRYFPDGTLDPSFGTNGKAMLRAATNHDAVAYAVTVLSDNKILVAGSSYGAKKNFALLKLKENGTADSTFGTNGWAVTPVGSYHDEAKAMAIHSDGRIVLAGTVETAGFNSKIYDFGVVRFSATGILETGAGAFGGGTGIVTTHVNGSDKVGGVGITADQKIIVAGTTDETGTNSNILVIRYNTDGSLDTSPAPGNFGANGIANIDLGNNGAGSTDVGNALVIQPNGNILITGMSKAVSGNNNDVATIRLTTDGALDPAFNPTGAIVGRTGSFTTAGIALFNYDAVANTDEGARAIALQSNGKIVVGGDTDGSASSFAFLLLRYNSDGTLDDSFDGGINGNGAITYNFTGSPDYGYGINLFSNRIYFVGSTGSNGSRNSLIAAIQNDGTPLPLVLGQFFAQKQTNKVVLQWSTTSEEGVKQFVVERSSDGKTYKAIGTVAAVGNSTFTQKYSFADAAPFMGANNYYRLLMRDADGNFKYSKFLVVKFDGQLTTEMKVNPSLVRDILQVQIPDGMKGNIGLHIIDMNGRVISKSNIASDGNALNTTLDVSSLITGVYIIKATAANNTTSVSRFTKAN